MPFVQCASLRLSGDAPGSIQFWFAPEWSSSSAGGAGPCQPATLLQAGDDGWRLTTDASGRFLELLALANLPEVKLIQTPIEWTAGQWHQVALSWEPGKRTALWLDGVAVADGPELPAVVEAVLWLGGDSTGQFLALGELDELYTDSHPVVAAEIAKDHAVHSPSGTLGPMSPAEAREFRKRIRTLRQARHDTAEVRRAVFVPPSPSLSLTLLEGSPPQIQVTLGHTDPGRSYRLEQTRDLASPDWEFVQNLVGVGVPVSLTLPLEDEAPMFFRVLEEAAPIFGFEGLGFAETGIEPPDIASAVGAFHVLQAFNGRVAIFDKATGTRLASTGLGPFFGLTKAADPRVLYDHRRLRWVASCLEPAAEGDPTYPFRNVYVMVSKGPDPSISSSDWWRYELSFDTPTADFDTLGMDAHGIYLTVAFEESGHFHAVVALPKDSLYDGTYVPATSAWLKVGPPELDAEIVQPAVNFDETDPGGPVWFMAKGEAEPGPPYRGGAIFYRRLHWSGTEAQWMDAGWTALSDEGNEYRDYFDLDESEFGAPQKQDVALPFDILIGRTGSRLCLPFIRHGHLWVAQHVGLSGPQGTYSGGSDGLAADRSAIQWFDLSINPAGLPLSGSSHGRIFDPSDADPVWYHFPSVAVNSVGDALLGFCGSGKALHLSVFSTWKPSAATVTGPTQILREGRWTCVDNRGPDYSTTCVDPSDDLALWTFQEHAATGPTEDLQFHTSALRLSGSG